MVQGKGLLSLCFLPHLSICKYSTVNLPNLRFILHVPPFLFHLTVLPCGKKDTKETFKGIFSFIWVSNAKLWEYCRYQTGALTPFIRWLSQGMQRAAGAQQPPRPAIRAENVPAAVRQGNENAAAAGAFFYS